MKAFVAVLCPLVSALLLPSNTPTTVRNLNRRQPSLDRLPMLLTTTSSSSPLFGAIKIQEDEDILPEGYLGASGSSDEFTVTSIYRVPDEIEWQSFLDSSPSVSVEKLQKWNIDTQFDSLNVTLPIALMIWDAEAFPTLSKARRECRQRRIVISTDNVDETQQQFSIGKVGDRVVSGDIIGTQKRLAPGQYADIIGFKAKPSFELPVVYQDDYMAIVIKPAGVLSYQEGGGGRNTIQFALPYVLQPCQSQESLEDALPRPQIVHRLDKPTSGLMVVAKTKSAVTNLCQQFEHRVVQKTYHAIVHGTPTDHDILTPSQVIEWLGKDVAERVGAEGWHLAENELDEKQAITLWRVLRTSPSPDGNLSLVELMPKTGRYHQLRRQMAWMYKTPIAGDPVYGAEFCGDRRFHRGLMLCASSITLVHPRSGASDMALRDHLEASGNATDDDVYMAHLSSKGGDVYLSASLSLPFKFQKYLQLQETRAAYSPQASE
jgi:23S rRNA-/tRNA-specific pseudouridylate synthase